MESKDKRTGQLALLKIDDEVIIKINYIGTCKLIKEKITRITPSGRIITTNHNMIGQEIGENKFNEEGVLREGFSTTSRILSPDIAFKEYGKYLKDQIRNKEVKIMVDNIYKLPIEKVDKLLEAYKTILEEEDK